MNCLIAARRWMGLLISLGVSITGCGSLPHQVPHAESFIQITIHADELSPLRLEHLIAIPLEHELREFKDIERLNAQLAKGLACFLIWFDSDRRAQAAHTKLIGAVERLVRTVPDVAIAFTLELMNDETSAELCSSSLRNMDPISGST